MRLYDSVMLLAIALESVAYTVRGSMLLQKLCRGQLNKSHRLQWAWLVHLRDFDRVYFRGTHLVSPNKANERKPSVAVLFAGTLARYRSCQFLIQDSHKTSAEGRLTINHRLQWSFTVHLKELNHVCFHGTQPRDSSRVIVRIVNAR